MRKLYFILLCVFVVLSNANAQCPAGRYLTEIFPAYTLDSVIYSTVYNLKVDIYQPAGDTMNKRPLIILAHGGSFVSGTRENDATVDSLCVRFAKRGYVTASIDYRLGNLVDMVLDSSVAIDVVIKAISDGKAAIRYFVKDAATTNTYKIDTDNIFIGGNSAGAVMFMHIGYIDSIGECPSYISSAMAANGGFEGNSGNDGYTTRSNAIIDLAGGLNETSFIHTGGKPSVNAQGDSDIVVPYTCGYPNLGSAISPVNVHVTLCGLGSMEPLFESDGIYHMSHVFPFDGHVPWASSAIKFDTVDSLVRVFLYNIVCIGVESVHQVDTKPEVSLYPNPVNEILNIRSSKSLNDITVYDETGRTILQANKINRENYEFNTSQLSKGMYFIKIRFSDESNTPVVRRILVE